MRTSILHSMCGPLCDEVLGTTRSSRRLDELESRNLLVVPLDHRREWYRYHHLFGELLSAELERREPEIVRELHRRAAAWFESNGLPETAIEHAQAAGDADHVANVVLQVANPVWASGRADTVMRWIEWFDSKELVEHHPGIAVHGALMFALMGRPGESAALGRVRGTRTFERSASRRKHGRGHSRVSARAPVPRRPRGDAPRRRDRREGAQPGESVSSGDASRRGARPPAPRRSRPRRPDIRSRS